VLDVLLDNAIRYAGPGATITIRVCDDAAGLRCIVADDGPGLPADGWSRATDRFWRGSAAGEGTGLGLAIAHDVVATWGGTLRLRPGDDERGTVAEVWLTSDSRDLRAAEREPR
jgi:signal transduction histidine kinase